MGRGRKTMEVFREGKRKTALRLTYISFNFWVPLIRPNILFEFSFPLKLLIPATLILVIYLSFLFEVSLSSLPLSHTAPYLGIAGFFLLPAPFFHSLIQRCLVPWFVRWVYHNISCSHFSLSGELLGSFIWQRISFPNLLTFNQNQKRPSNRFQPQCPQQQQAVRSCFSFTLLISLPGVHVVSI